MGKASRRKAYWRLDGGRPVRCAPEAGGLVFTHHQEGDVTICLRKGGRHVHKVVSGVQAEDMQRKLVAKGIIHQDGENDVSAIVTRQRVV